MEETPAPPGMYKTMWIMGYLPYQLVWANHSNLSLSLPQNGGDCCWNSPQNARTIFNRLLFIYLNCIFVGDINMLIFSILEHVTSGYRKSSQYCLQGRHAWAL